MHAQERERKKENERERERKIFFDQAKKERRYSGV